MVTFLFHKGEEILTRGKEDQNQHFSWKILGKLIILFFLTSLSFTLSVYYLFIYLFILRDLQPLIRKNLHLA